MGSLCGFSRIDRFDRITLADRLRYDYPGIDHLPGQGAGLTGLDQDVLRVAILPGQLISQKLSPTRSNSSAKTLRPWRRGRAIKFPKPPRGRVSWLGKNRS